MVEKRASLEAAGAGAVGGERQNYVRPPGPGPQGPGMKRAPKDIKPRLEIARSKQGRAHRHEDEEEEKAAELSDYLARNYP